MRALRLRTSRVSCQDDEAKRLFGWKLRNCTGLARHVITEEHFFAKEEGRNHRFDFALPVIALGIEINGGIWNQGAHGRPAMILRNMEKLNLAAALGWRVLSFSTDQAKSGAALAFTVATIERLGRQLLCKSEMTPSQNTSPVTRLPPLGGGRKRKTGLRSCSLASLVKRSSPVATGSR